MVPSAESVAVTAGTGAHRAGRPIRVLLGIDAVAVDPSVCSARTGGQRQADELALVRVRAGVRSGGRRPVRPTSSGCGSGVQDGHRHTVLTGWYAEALGSGRWRATDHRAALDACRTGLDLLDDIVAEAPTLEQRSAAMRLGHDLSQFTIELAVDRGDADTVLAAAEGTRRACAPRRTGRIASVTAR